MKEGRIVSRDPEVMSGELVFSGTRVEVKTLVDYLRAGHTLDEFWKASRASPASRPRATSK